jgi:lipopolysaccharide transport system ATP-binding protein
MNAAIQVEGLSKHYRLGTANTDTMLRERLANLATLAFLRKRQPEQILWALRDVSFSVAPGEVVGIIGRNGAGKSTLLKILSKITYPTAGSIKVNGRVASLLEVGTGFHEELTGRENIYLNGSILGMKKREVDAKLDAIVAFSGVERFIDTPIKRYSSGMRLRLGFAVAAHLDPDVLIVDEVLAVGDAGFQKKCIGAMQDLRRDGRTVLFVSHNMAAVENLCSRAIWIHGGQVQCDTDAQTAIQSYMSAFADETKASMDLRDFKDRRGTGEIRYTAIEFLSSNGDILNYIRSGDALTIRLYYEAGEPIPHPSFGFRLSTEFGTLITDTSTWHHGIDIPLVLPGHGHIDLKIDSINLLQGRYYFTLGLTDTQGTPYDLVEQCAYIDIDVADVYRCGRGVDNKYGLVYFPQRWKLEGVYTEQEPAVAVQR